MLDSVCCVCKKLPAPNIIDTKTYPNITSGQEFFFVIRLFFFVISLFQAFSCGKLLNPPALHGRRHTLQLSSFISGSHDFISRVVPVGIVLARMYDVPRRTMWPPIEVVSLPGRTDGHSSLAGVFRR